MDQVDELTGRSQFRFTRPLAPALLEGSGLLSIKSFRGGRAYYKIGDGSYLVDDECFLIANHGQVYEIAVDPATVVDSFCVFFASDFAADVQYSLTSATGILLDNPVTASAAAPFFERTYTHDAPLAPVLAHFRAAYPQRERESAWVEEQLHRVLAGMLSVNREAYEYWRRCRVCAPPHGKNCTAACRSRAIPSPPATINRSSWGI